MSPVFRHGRLRLYLLKLLDEAPRHGYEVIRLLQDRFMGIYAPSPGTIYPRLARLEEEGLVTHDEADGRKVYRITAKGREELHARLDDLAELEEEITASVRDIAREVTEDVRETVRTLREELSWAAREFHSRAHQAAGGADPGGDLRHARTGRARPGSTAAPTRRPTATWNGWPSSSAGNCGPPPGMPRRSARTRCATCAASWTRRSTGSGPRYSRAKPRPPTRQTAPRPPTRQTATRPPSPHTPPPPPPPPLTCPPA